MTDDNLRLRYGSLRVKYFEEPHYNEWDRARCFVNFRFDKGHFSHDWDICARHWFLFLYGIPEFVEDTLPFNVRMNNHALNMVQLVLIEQSRSKEIDEFEALAKKEIDRALTILGDLSDVKFLEWAKEAVLRPCDFEATKKMTCALISENLAMRQRIEKLRAKGIRA